MSAAEKNIDDLCRYSVLDIVRPDEISKLIADRTFKSIDDWKEMVQDEGLFLDQECDSRCLVMKLYGTFRCRKLDYLFVSHVKNRHTYLDFSTKLSKDCLKRLIRI